MLPFGGFIDDGGFVDKNIHHNHTMHGYGPGWVVQAKKASRQSARSRVGARCSISDMTNAGASISQSTGDLFLLGCCVRACARACM